MKTNIIYNTSSENMPQIDDKSVKLVVTSPPYNINIQYGNKTSKGQIVSSKGAKYKDNLDEDTYIYIFIYISAFFISSEILIPNPSAIFLIFCIDTFRFPASTDE